MPTTCGSVGVGAMGEILVRFGRRKYLVWSYVVIKLFTGWLYRQYVIVLIQIFMIFV